MRVRERHLAAVALVACLFLPYYPTARYLLVDAGFKMALQLLVGGGPCFLASSAACALAVYFLLTDPRGAIGPATGWLAFWLVGLVWWTALSWPALPWWPWIVALLVGIWVLSVGMRATRKEVRQTEVSVFD